MKFAFLLAFLVSLGASADVTFVPLRKAQAGSDGEYFTYRPDAAAVEFRAPLAPSALASITVAQLQGYTQEQLDQLYFRLHSGPFPQSDYRTTILVKNTLVQSIEGRLLQTLTNGDTFKGFVRQALFKLLCKDKDGLQCVGEYLWKGKRFYTATADGTRQMRNAVPTLLQNSLVLKTAGLGTLATPMSRALSENFGGARQLMMFPANVYCGASLIDVRRESIIIDYAYGDDFTPFIKEVDGLVARDGENLRDEIRMVRPGLYLGRAYMDKVFLLNFILEATSATSRIGSASACWAGNSWQ